MSKLSKAVNARRENNSLRRDETVTNFMGGESYTLDPLTTMKMIMTSSIFGEPSYYRDSEDKYATKYQVNDLVRDASILPSIYEGQTTNAIMENAINMALDYDFLNTLEFAVTLRRMYNMRLNPQIIMVRAAIHPKRKEFTKSSPSSFDKINNQVMQRPDEAMTQMAYYLYLNGGKKNNIPSILKRSWAKKMSSYDRYAVSKYKNHEIGMINGVRLCHAHSGVIDELMKTGTVAVNNEIATWEQYRSAGYDWRWIIDNCSMGHMAMLRNLRGIFTEVYDQDRSFCKKYIDKLTDGVKTGKQFPFRYWSAMKAIEKSDCNHKILILDALMDCLEISIENYPKLKGKTMCLSDNSGSAWGAFNSEYGSVTVAEIDNLSSVITARCSDEGYVGKFGDKLKVYPISKRDSVLSQVEKVNETRGADVGHSTEGGIWEFFKNTIEKHEHWDNIFIYSDCQAGHGELFGTKKQLAEYKDKYGFGWNLDYINVFALIQEYRKKVNPKVNVFCVQTAGYDNALIPEYAYRTNILYGWTGREAEFAAKMIDQWDEIEAKNELGRALDEYHRQYSLE